MVYKMIVSKKPVSMHEKMTKNEHSYNTRMWVHVKDGKDGPLYGSNLTSSQSEVTDAPYFFILFFVESL